MVASQLVFLRSSYTREATTSSLLPQVAFLVNELYGRSLEDSNGGGKRCWARLRSWRVAQAGGKAGDGAGLVEYGMVESMVASATMREGGWRDCGAWEAGWPGVRLRQRLTVKAWPWGKG